MLTNSGLKKQARKKRHNSLRKRIEGTDERPRLAVFRSTRHIYAQVIDDHQRKTLVSISDMGLGDAPAPAPAAKPEADGDKGDKGDKKEGGGGKKMGATSLRA